MIEIKAARNNVMNNFEFVINSLGYTVFTPRASEVDKIQLFCRKTVFLSTLEAPREKTVYLRELRNLYSNVATFDGGKGRESLKIVNWDRVQLIIVYCSHNINFHGIYLYHFKLDRK